MLMIHVNLTMTRLIQETKLARLDPTDIEKYELER